MPCRLVQIQRRIFRDGEFPQSLINKILYIQQYIWGYLEIESNGLSMICSYT